MSTFRVTIGWATIATHTEIKEAISFKEFLDAASAERWIRRSGFSEMGGGLWLPPNYAAGTECLACQVDEVPAARPTPKGDVVLPSMG